jgi:hypothetical protein
MVDGYLEVPRCGDDCAIPDQGNSFQFQNQGPPAAQESINVSGAYPQAGQSNSQMTNPYPTPAVPPQRQAMQAPKKVSKTKSFLKRLGIGSDASTQRAPERQASNGFMWPGETTKR